MVADEEQQQSIIQKVRDTLLAYHTRDAVRNELVSLASMSGQSTRGAVSLEEHAAEMFVQTLCGWPGQRPRLPRRHVR